ncbi:hypothetical protein AHF37_02496 [Paragonimus kellicotti]|nr:hypothetical protein AHF37_02496 [Paragonimus kellicotti]
MSACKLKKTVGTTTQGTTLVPGITQPVGLAPLDLLTRYPLQSLLLQRFSPVSIDVDRYISPLWLPFSLVGCTVCAIVYGTTRWKQGSNGVRMASSFARINPTVSRSLYLASLSVIQLLRSFIVIVIDLDTAWDTALLSWNQLICPLTHTFATATKLAASLLTLTIGVEVLSVIYEKPVALWMSPIHFLVARGRTGKALHICIGIAIISCLYGLIETAYWRVQYYLPTFPAGQSSVFAISHTPMARCEVTGQFQYFFSAKTHKLTSMGRLDASGQHDTSTYTATSYADFKWISGITVECALSLLSICVALAIVRTKLMDRTILMQSMSPKLTTLKKTAFRSDIKFIAIIALVQGLCRLPEALLMMLEPLTRPGEVNLTDSELELDGTWYRYFMMLTTRLVAQELADLPGALLLPICLMLSKQFRRDFGQLCGYRRKVTNQSKPTDTSLRRSTCGSAQCSTDLPCKLGHTLSPGSPLLHTPVEAIEQRFYPTANHPQFDMNLQTGRPVWKWGEGWTMPHAGLASQSVLNRPHQTTPYREPQMFSKSTLHHSNDQLSLHSNKYTNQRMVPQTSLYRRTASVNDLLLERSYSVERTPLFQPRQECEVEWFEPRSYV